MKAVLAILLLAVIPSFLFAQNAKYTPQAPAYKINGEEVLYNGYIINRNGAKVFTKEMDYAGFCFNFKTMLPVINETDSLVMVAFNENNNEFFYISKKNIGIETDIPLSNYDLNERYIYNDQWRDEHINFEENCGKSYADDYENSFNSDDYPDVIVTPISEKDFFNAKRTAVPNYLAIDKTIKKRGNTIIIGGKKFMDGLGEGNQPNIYTYMGDYQKLNASLLEFMCSACEEYSYELIDKRTGKEIATFTNVPVFSKDYKYVMDLGQLFSNNPTILSYYQWKETLKPNTGTYKEYANWSPVGKGFWGNDNYFYTAVVPTITIDSHNA